MNDNINKIIYNNTITSYGKHSLTKILNTTIYTKQQLLRRQHLINLLLKSPLTVITKNLNKINKANSDIGWFFTPITQTSQTLPELQSFKNNFKIYSSKVFLLIIIALITITTYYNKLPQIYNSSTKLMNTVIKNDKLSSFLTNITIFVIIIFFIMSSINSLNDSSNHQKKLSNQLSKINSIKSVITSTTNLSTLIKPAIQLTPSQKRDLAYLTTQFNTTSTSKLIQLKNNHRTLIKPFNNILKYIALIDSHTAIAKLITQNNFSMPIFDFTSTSPHLKIKYHNATINFGEVNHQTPYKNDIMTSVLLAQTLGVTNCITMSLTPFELITITTPQNLTESLKNNTSKNILSITDKPIQTAHTNIINMW